MKVLYHLDPNFHQLSFGESLISLFASTLASAVAYIRDAHIIPHRIIFWLINWFNWIQDSQMRRDATRWLLTIPVHTNDFFLDHRLSLRRLTDSFNLKQILEMWADAMRWLRSWNLTQQASHSFSWFQKHSNRKHGKHSNQKHQRNSNRKHRKHSNQKHWNTSIKNIGNTQIESMKNTQINNIPRVQNCPYCFKQ